jgi:hypothetical protein
MSIKLHQLVKEQAMTRLEYNKLRGWDLPSNENGDDTGYMIADIEGADNCTELGLKGYISWMTSEEFDRRTGNSKSTEQMIQDANLEAPRLTPDLVNAKIAKTEFHILTDVLTMCVLTLQNGFTVTGESACASPENFNKEIGEKIAKENATEKIWALEGYLLKQRIYEGK